MNQDAAAGALAVGSGIFLILELSQPYTGFFPISPAAFEQAIDSIDKRSAPDPRPGA